MPVSRKGLTNVGLSITVRTDLHRDVLILINLLQPDQQSGKWDSQSNHEASKNRRRIVFFHLYKRTAMAMTFGTLLLSTYSNEWRRNRPAELKCQTFHGGGAPASDTHLIVFPSSSSET